MKNALILVDIQNDYFPGGRNELVGSEAALANARTALDCFRRRGLPLCHVQHISLQPGATFFLPDTEGIGIRDEVRPEAGEKVVVKHKPDSFLDTDLQEYLASVGAERLVVCGMMTHMCIDTTVRSARARGYDIILLHDACATKDLAWNGRSVPAETVQAVYMASLQGSFARIAAADEVASLLDN